MRLLLAVLAGSLALAGVAGAQTSMDAGYVEVVAQSALGNVTSQSYGVEGGFTIRPNIQLFVEVGQTKNVAPSTLGAAAQLIAGGLGQTQANVGYTAKEPATFGDVGLRYVVHMANSAAQPYVLAGIGAARLKRDVAFTVGGTDVTANLAQDQYGNITLGSDLSGSETKAMFVLGGGLAWAAWQRLNLDLQFRYGRIMAADAGINVIRAGIGIGVRF